MWTTDIHLPQFKIQGQLQKNADFKFRYIKIHTEKKTSKIFNITFAILPFSYRNTLIKLLSWVLWSLFLLTKSSDAL